MGIPYLLFNLNLFSIIKSSSDSLDRYTLKSFTANVPVNVSPALRTLPVSISLPLSKSKTISLALPLPSKSVGIIGFIAPVIEESFTHCL